MDKKVNIEEIMKEIQEKADAHNYNDFLPEFASLQVDAGNRLSIANNKEQFHENVGALNKAYNLRTDYYGRNPIKKIWHKVCNKIRNVLFGKQIHVNYLLSSIVIYIDNVIDTLVTDSENKENDQKIEKYISYQEKATENLQTRVIELENRILQLESELKELRGVRQKD